MSVVASKPESMLAPVSGSSTHTPLRHARPTLHVAFGKHGPPRVPASEPVSAPLSGPMQLPVQVDGVEQPKIGIATAAIKTPIVRRCVCMNGLSHFLLAAVLTACPPSQKSTADASTSGCTSVGQSCEFAPGKLGACVRRDDCTPSGTETCMVCQSQH